MTADADPCLNPVAAGRREGLATRFMAVLLWLACCAASAQSAAQPASPALGATPELALDPALLVGPPEINPAGDPDSASFIGPPLALPFYILDQQVEPGSTEWLQWNASQTYAGGDLNSPVVVVHGERPGPVLCLTGGVHGDELNGVEIVRRVVNQLDPAELSGTVIGVPIVNLFGFSRNSRYLPDRRDLNRFFPGTDFGSIASRIARSFFDNVVRHCHALVDFHTGSFARSNLPQVRADLRIPHVLELTRGFGATPVLHSDGSRGMLRHAATQSGIPAVTFEVGGPAELQPVEIEFGVQATMTLLHRQGMVRDDVHWDEPQPIFYESTWLRSDHGGMLLSDIALGQRVQPGQRLGRVVDPTTNVENEVTSPIYGRVIGMARNQVVLPGYAVFHLGEETSEVGAVEKAESAIEVLPYEDDSQFDEPRLLDDEGFPRDEAFDDGYDSLDG